MNVAELIKRWGSTLAGVVRYLVELAAEDCELGRRRLERAVLDHSFERFQFKVGERTWKRSDLYTRS
jgi:hypothetical protein